MSLHAPGSGTFVLNRFLVVFEKSFGYNSVKALWNQPVVGGCNIGENQ